MASNKPDPTFRLAAEQRANLIPNINVEALEQLLRYVPPEARGHLLDLFTQAQHGQNQQFQLTRIVGGDSTMNALLAEIWAPTWEAWGLDAIETAESPLPGRELARARLSVRKTPTAPND